MGCEAGAPQVVREGSHGAGWMLEGWRPRVCEGGFLQLRRQRSRWGPVGSRGVQGWGPQGARVGPMVCEGGVPWGVGWGYAGCEGGVPKGVRVGSHVGCEGGVPCVV